MTQWPSRSWRPSNRKVVSSALRRPQPISSESRARLRRLRGGIFRTQQLLAFLCRQPISDRHSQQQDTLHAAYACRQIWAEQTAIGRFIRHRRIAANLRFIVDGAYGCCSSAIRYRLTTVRLKASLGSEQYQSMKPRMAWSYERLELVEVSLFKTADFDCSRSGSLRTVLGARLRLLFAIGNGLLSPRRKA